MIAGTARSKILLHLKYDLTNEYEGLQIAGSTIQERGDLCRPFLSYYCLYSTLPQYFTPFTILLSL